MPSFNFGQNLLQNILFFSYNFNYRNIFLVFINKSEHSKSVLTALIKYIQKLILYSAQYDVTSTEKRNGNNTMFYIFISQTVTSKSIERLMTLSMYKR